MLLILEVLATIVGAVLTGIVLFFLVRTLTTAGKGSFLKERNEELASALEQMRSQRDDERDECQRQISELRDQVNQVRGELAAHRVQYASVIATAVLAEFRSAGVLPPGNGA